MSATVTRPSATAILQRAARWAVLCAVLFVPAVALAQNPSQNSGVIIGVVTDPSQKRLPGVTITVRTSAGFRTVVTDVNGRYRIPLLPLGTHRVVAELAGFTLTAKEVELTSRYPENDGSFVMYVSAESRETIPGPAPRYRILPLSPAPR